MLANILFLTRNIGPAEGLVVSNLKASGHTVLTYDVAGAWLPNRGDMPLWMRGYRMRTSAMGRNHFNRILTGFEAEFAIASGFEAAGFAASNCDTEFIPLLWSGALDFSAMNDTLTQTFGKLLATNDRLLLEDPWEMDKAVSKGSLVPHFRLPYPDTPDQSVLVSDSGSVAVLYPAAMDQERIDNVLQELRRRFGRLRNVEAVEIESLYRFRDLQRGRDAFDILSYRLKEFSFAAILGSGPHHSTVMRVLRSDQDRVVVDQTIAANYRCKELGFSHFARGLRIADVLQDVVSGAELSDGRRGSSVSEAQDYLEQLTAVYQCPVPEFYEELPALESVGPLNVFFSVASLEDITNGARPQRIRNMHEAFEDRLDAFSVFGTEISMNRRFQFLRSVLDSRGAGIFYGENSTSPLPERSSAMLADFLDDFKSFGGRVAWFTRDLHWLESFTHSVWHPERAEALKEAGLLELERVAGRADILACPSDSSAEGFNGLLRTHGQVQRKWLSLPPAIARENIVRPLGTENSDKVTIVYSGGVSSFYGMDLYIEAVSTLPDVYLDFVVRPADEHQLTEALKRFGLEEDPRIRILNSTMDFYVPRTQPCFGAILLDSSYAKFSFPYKTVTMIERGFPILCYSDMGIADFVVENNVGVAVDRNAESLRNGIETLRDSSAQGMEGVRRREDWNSRVDKIVRSLGA